MRFCIKVLFVLVLLMVNNTHAQHNYPGGIVELLIDKESPQLPEVRYGTREVIVIEKDTQWRVLVGLGLDTLPGEYLIYIKRATQDSRAFVERFNVEQKDYPILRVNRKASDIHIQHSSLSDLDFSNTEQPSLPLRYPVDGNWTKRFGQVSNTNSDKVVRQNLVSINITQISTVIAPQNAIVSRIETNEFDISTLFLDHGRGLYSIIHGVSDLSVQTGNGVVAGAVLGKSAYYEGRASLIRWQCVMNGVYINPILLTEPL